MSHINIPSVFKRQNTGALRPLTFRELDRVPLGRFLEDFPGFKVKERTRQEDGKVSVVCRNEELDIERSLVLSAKDEMTGIYAARQVGAWHAAERTAKNKIGASHATIGPDPYETYRAEAVFRRKGDTVTIRLKEAEYLQDSFKMADKDPGLPDQLQERMEALRAAKEKIASLAEAAQKSCGLQLHKTPKMIELEHPLLDAKPYRDAEHPMKPGEVDAFFHDATEGVLKRQTQLMDKARKLEESGFTVDQRSKQEGGMELTISRPGDVSFTPVSFPIDPHTGIFIENPQKRIQALESEKTARAAREALKSAPNFFAPITEALKKMPRVVVIMDSCSFNKCAGMVKERGYKQDFIMFAMRNPALSLVGVPSVVGDLEIMNRIPDPDSDYLKDGDYFRYLRYHVNRLSKGEEGTTNLRHHLATASRWMVDGGELSRFMPAVQAGGKMVVYESSQQNEFYRNLSAAAQSHLDAGSNLMEAFREARAKLAKNKGEGFCVQLAKDYPGRESVIVLSDDNHCADMVNKLAKNRQDHTKGGGAISWMSSKMFLEDLDRSCNHELARQLKSPDSSGAAENLETILRDIDKHDELGGKNPSSEVFRRLPQQPIYGRDEQGVIAPDLVVSLRTGEHVQQLLQRHLGPSIHKERYLGSLAGDSRTLSLAQSVLSGRADERGSRIY